MKTQALLLLIALGLACLVKAEEPVEQEIENEHDRNRIDDPDSLHWKPKPPKPPTWPTKPPVVKPTTQAPVQNSTSASSGTTYDWGQHTKTQAPNQNSTSGSSGTTEYDWGQHTGSTYDWGQHTSTQAPNVNATQAPVQNSTSASSGTTYDWGQHTKTQAPNQNSTSSGTTEYDWGQHTGSTYDWGQHTGSTQAPGNGTDDNGNNGNGDNGQGDNQNKCGPGAYACAGAIGLCIGRKQICNGQIDCPHADDEEPTVCHPSFAPGAGGQQYKNTNKFRGQGFMFHIRNIKIGGGSQVKLFEQDSNNLLQKSG